MIVGRMMSLLLGAGALGSLINAGVFFAFSAFVMPAFAKLPPGHAASAMQSINVVILGSAFMPVFLGTALVALAALCGGWWSMDGVARTLAVGGGLLFLAGGLGVTMAFNVPLNDQLAAAGPNSQMMWASYLAAWTMWNTVRALGCTAAGISFGIAAFR